MDNPIKHRDLGFVPIVIGLEAGLSAAMMHSMMTLHDMPMIIVGSPNSGKSRFMDDIAIKNFPVRQFTAEMLRPINPWIYWDRIPRKYKKELKKKGLL
jgi:hypothetical protein